MVSYQEMLISTSRVIWIEKADVAEYEQNLI